MGPLEHLKKRLFGDPEEKRKILEKRKIEELAAKGWKVEQGMAAFFDPRAWFNVWNTYDESNVVRPKEDPYMAGVPSTTYYLDFDEDFARGMELVAAGIHSRMNGSTSAHAFVSKKFSYKNAAGNYLDAWIDVFGLKNLEGDTPIEKALYLLGLSLTSQEMVAEHYAKTAEADDRDSDEEGEGDGADSQNKDELEGEEVDEATAREFKRISKGNDVAGGVLGDPQDLSRPKKMNLLERSALEAIARVEKLDTVSIGTSTELVENPHGEVEIPELLQDVADFEYINPADFAMPLFDLELVTGSLVIDKPYSKLNRKQQIVLLIDRSGSMYNGIKQGYVKGILMHLLNEVLKGDAVVYVSEFEWRVDGFFELKTKKDMLDFITGYTCSGGGDTDIEGCLIHTQKCIDRKLLTAAGGRAWSGTGNKQFKSRARRIVLPYDVNPQIVVINDGEDKIDPFLKLSAPVHTLILGENNNDLRSVCENSGGSYHQLVSYDEIAESFDFDDYW
jgi:hypothetical protein